MLFRDVTGQPALKEKLPLLVQQNRLSHAMMFLAADGTGGLPMALAFAQYLVCDRTRGVKPATTGLFADEPAAPADTSDACGHCPACRKAAALAHPDIHYAYPVVTKKPGKPSLSTDYIEEWRGFVKESPYGSEYDWLQYINAENKQGNITAAECDDIIKKLSLKSFEAGYKILIMWKPEALGKEGNKLLKLIEEPPPDTVFILVAENDDLVLPTILSRTQLFKFPPVSIPEITSGLIEKYKAEPTAAAQAATLADGSFREAIEQLNQGGESWDTLIRDWLNFIVRRQYADQNKWIDQVSKLGREKQKQFLLYFMHILSLAIEISGKGLENVTGAHTGNAEFAKETDTAQRLNKICGAAEIEAIMHELDSAGYYIERNANAKMLFHALTIKLYHIIVNKEMILIN